MNLTCDVSFYKSDMSNFSNVRLSFVDLRWAHLYVSLVVDTPHPRRVVKGRFKRTFVLIHNPQCPPIILARHNRSETFERSCLSSLNLRLALCVGLCRWIITQTWFSLETNNQTIITQNKLHIISKGIRQILENLVPQHWSFTFLKICSTSTSASQKEVGYRILGSKSEPKLEAMEPNFIINMTWARFIRLASL